MNILGRYADKYSDINIDVDGHLFTDNYIWNTNTLAWEKATGSAGAGNVTVTNFPATQPISAVSLPLPIGAATSAKQDTGNTSLSAITTNIADSTVTGTVSILNDTVTITTDGRANVAWQISYTSWTGQITFEGSAGNGWIEIFGYLAGTGQTKTKYTNPATDTIYRCTVAGFSQVRVRLSNANSGTLTLYGRASSHTSGIFLNFPLPIGANLIGSVGQVDALSVAINPATKENQATIISNLQAINSLTPNTYDYINLAYNSNLDLQTAIFKTGGSGGATVATLTLAYDANLNLQTVTRV